MQFQLNLERLHRCVEAIRTGQLLDRGEGATTARLMLLIGDVELGDYGNLYIMVVDNQTMVDITQRALCDILTEYGYEITHHVKGRVTFGNAIQVRFLTAGQFFDTHAIRGLRVSRVFFDVSQHALMKYDSEMIEYSLMVARAGGADIV